MNETKVCTKCGEEKVIEEFHHAREYPDGHRAQCRNCVKEYQRRWRKKNSEKRCSYERKRRNGKARFGTALIESRNKAKRKGYIPCNITVKELKAAFIGKCIICNTLEMNGRWKKLHMDHCHKTGKFRGWLCSNCNKALGFAKDSPELLEHMAAYLRKNSQ